MKVLEQGEVRGGDIPAHETGEVRIPAAVRGANALMLTITDTFGRELFTYSYRLEEVLARCRQWGQFRQEKKRWTI